jgi:4-hydroxy-4-methyl-2-oxoglutarate aldolase
VADVNGVVVVPAERLIEVVEVAERILAQENAMMDALRAGASIVEVDRRFQYERMLKPPTGTEASA